MVTMKKSEVLEKDFLYFENTFFIFWFNHQYKSDCSQKIRRKKIWKAAMKELEKLFNCKGVPHKMKAKIIHSIANYYVRVWKLNNGEN